MQELIHLVGQQTVDLELFAVVAWFIWNHRNRLRLNEKGMATDKILTTAKEYLLDFQLKFLQTVTNPSKARIRWRPPLGELYKTNYDGAVFRESGEASIGVVVRDAKGEVIAALAKKSTYPGSVLMLEALAARRAAKFVMELGISLFEFEADLEVVYRALRTVD